MRLEYRVRFVFEDFDYLTGFVEGQVSSFCSELHTLANKCKRFVSLSRHTNSRTPFATSQTTSGDSAMIVRSDHFDWRVVSIISGPRAILSNCEPIANSITETGRHPNSETISLQISCARYAYQSGDATAAMGARIMRRIATANETFCFAMTGC